MRPVRPVVRRRERGVILISALLLLAVITIFAITMFRSFGIEEKIAANVRDKERAMHSAMSALQYAEWWVSQPGNGVSPLPCAGGLLYVALGQGLLCNRASTLVGMVNGNDLTAVPWMAGGTEVGTVYQPATMTISTTGGLNTYYDAPRFYVQYVGHLPAPTCGNVYLIDAWGYGGTKSSVAVVESTYQIYFSDCG